MADKEKSTIDSLKDGFLSGFKPASARADEAIAEKRKQGPSQYEQDKSQGSQAMRSKFVKGFYGN